MARDFSRTDRIADVMQKELAQIIQQEMKDPRIGLVTIAAVKVVRDLSHAKVYVSVLSEETAQESIKTLNSAAGFLRGLLAKRIQLRTMPALHFVYDDTTLKANRLSRLIDEAVAKDKHSHQEKDEENE